MRDAAFDGLEEDSVDPEDMEGLVQISSGLTRPYDQHAVNHAQRLNKKQGKTIKEKLTVMLRIQKFKKNK